MVNDVHVAPPAPPRWYESLFIAVGVDLPALRQAVVARRDEWR